MDFYKSGLDVEIKCEEEEYGSYECIETHADKIKSQLDVEEEIRESRLKGLRDRLNIVPLYEINNNDAQKEDGVNVVGIIESFNLVNKRDDKKKLERAEIVLRDNTNRVKLTIFASKKLDSLSDYRQFIEYGNMMWVFNVIRHQRGHNNLPSLRPTKMANYWLMAKNGDIAILPYRGMRKSNLDQKAAFNFVSYAKTSSLIELIKIPVKERRRIVVQIIDTENSPLLEGETFYVTDYFRMDKFQEQYEKCNYDIALPVPGLAVNFMNLSSSFDYHPLEIGKIYALEGYLDRDGSFLFFQVDFAKDREAVKLPTKTEYRIIKRGIEEWRKYGDVNGIDPEFKIGLKKASKYIRCDLDQRKYPTVVTLHNLLDKQQNNGEVPMRVLGKLRDCQLFLYDYRRVVLTLEYFAKVIKVEFMREAFFGDKVLDAKKLIDNYIMNDWIIVAVKGKVSPELFRGVDTSIPDGVIRAAVNEYEKRSHYNDLDYYSEENEDNEQLPFHAV